MIAALSYLAAAMSAASPHGASARPTSEAGLKLPDFSNTFDGTLTYFGMSGWSLLALGLVVCVIGLIFGMVVFNRLKNMEVHGSMKSISELIYETCKTYLKTQAKFIAILWVFIATIIVVYFGVLEKVEVPKVAAIALFSVIGILG